MQEYHKIQTVFKRDPATKHRTLLMGEYSMPEFEYLAGNTWIFTEKVDGTNIRIGVEKSMLSIKGRTDNAQIPTFLLTTLMELFPVEKLLSVFGDGGPPDEFCLYGEGYGSKIQKVGGNYNSDGVSFVLFDISIGDWWLKREDVVDIASQLGVEVVPILGEGGLDSMVNIARAGITSRWGDFQAEGIVARPQVELKARSGHRIITKIKTRDFPKD